MNKLVIWVSLEEVLIIFFIFGRICSLIFLYIGIKVMFFII